MLWWVLLTSVVLNAAMADIGKVVSISGNADAYLLRGGKRMTLKAELPLVKGDEVYLLKGKVRTVIRKDSEFVIRVKDASFSSSGGEFEVALEGESADLEVTNGEVVFSSPHIHTFVPEIVKQGEGLRFSSKQKKYFRRKLKRGP